MAFYNNFHLLKKKKKSTPRAEIQNTKIKNKKKKKKRKENEKNSAFSTVLVWGHNFNNLESTHFEDSCIAILQITAPWFLRRLCTHEFQS